MHVSTPVSILHRLTRRTDQKVVEASRSGIQVDEFGVRHLVPKSALPAGILAVTTDLLLSQLGIGHFDAIFVDQPLMYSNALSELGDRVIYRPTDRYDRGLKALRQRQICSRASGICATSREVLGSLSIPDELPTIVLPNGVEYARFAEHSDGVFTDRPRKAVYVGALDERFDWDAVQVLSRANPAWTFDLYGPAVSKIPLLEANVRWHGTLDYRNIPRVLATARVGLLPFRPTSANEARSHMKRYEYLAAGLHILGLRTPSFDDVPHTGTAAYRDEHEMLQKFTVLASAHEENHIGRETAKSKDWAICARSLCDFASALPAAPPYATNRGTP